MQKKGYILSVLTGLIFLLTIGMAQSQNKHFISIRGSNIHLHINSLNRYEYGYELRDWTRLVIDIKEGDIADGKIWTLNAFAGTDSLLGDYGNSLAVDYLTLTAKLSPGSTNTENIELKNGGSLDSTVPLELAIISGHGKFELLISYSIGKEENKRLMGKPFDYYSSDLFFQLYSAD
jgi:hypothetical protein